MAEEYFGMVRWNEDDLRNALEENDVRPTDERVAQLRKLCESSSFEEAMIGAGWDIIYGYVNNGRINTTRFSADEIDRAAARLCRGVPDHSASELRRVALCLSPHFPRSILP